MVVNLALSRISQSSSTIFEAPLGDLDDRLSVANLALFVEVPNKKRRADRAGEGLCFRWRVAELDRVDGPEVANINKEDGHCQQPRVTRNRLLLVCNVRGEQTPEPGPAQVETMLQQEPIRHSRESRGTEARMEFI